MHMNRAERDNQPAEIKKNSENISSHISGYRKLDKLQWGEGEHVKLCFYCAVKSELQTGSVFEHRQTENTPDTSVRLACLPFIVCVYIYIPASTLSGFPGISILQEVTALMLYYL